MKTHQAFWLEFVGKIGPPVLAGSIVACLVQERFGWIHGVVAGAGLGMMLLHHFLTTHRP
jgi:hypothetical protein